MPAGARLATVRDMDCHLPVIRHTALPARCDAGCHRQLVAGPGIGALPVRVELLSLEAAACTAMAAQPHAQAVVVLAGSGKLRLGSDPQSFTAPCTLLVPAGVAHEIVNNGVLPLQLVAIAAATPSLQENPR